MINVIHKNLLIPVVTLIGVGIVGTTILGARSANAQTKGTFFSGLAQAIAQKFNLNQADVQTVIDQYGQTQRQTMLKTRLDKLVADTKITPDQETAIINELATKPSRTDFEAWLKSQNLDPKTLGFFGFGMPRDHFGHWAKPSTTPSP